MANIKVFLSRVAVTAHIYLRWGVVSSMQAVKHRQIKRQLARARGMLTIRIDSHVGLFAQLSWCLLIAEFCRQRGLTPTISLVGHQYGDNGENWFPVLFGGAVAETDKPMSRVSESMLVSHIQELIPSFQALLPAFRDLNFDLSLEDAHQLQQRYFPVRPEIVSVIDDFVAQHFRNSTIVGCHYRGTDKSLEADRVSYDAMIEALRLRLAEHSEAVSLFVATDEAAFIDHVRAALPGVHLITADHARSNDGQPLHEGANLIGRSHAIEAMTDCLLLSRCDILVKSTSLLSAWSKVFNPSLPVTLIGSPKPDMFWFPENTLHNCRTRLA